MQTTCILGDVYGSGGKTGEGDVLLLLCKPLYRGGGGRLPYFWEGYEHVSFCSVDLTSGDDTPPDSNDMLDVAWCLGA